MNDETWTRCGLEGPFVIFLEGERVHVDNCSKPIFIYEYDGLYL